MTTWESPPNRYDINLVKQYDINSARNIESIQLLRSGFVRVELALLRGQADKIDFEAGSDENFVDPNEQIALQKIVFRGKYDRKIWTKLGLVGYRLQDSMGLKLI